MNDGGTDVNMHAVSNGDTSSHTLTGTTATGAIPTGTILIGQKHAAGALPTDAALLQPLLKKQRTYNENESTIGANANNINSTTSTPYNMYLTPAAGSTTSPPVNHIGTNHMVTNNGTINVASPTPYHVAPISTGVTSDRIAMVHVARQYIARLKKWQSYAQDELQMLKSLPTDTSYLTVQPSSTSTIPSITGPVSYYEYARPYVPPYTIIDEQTNLPSLTGTATPSILPTSSPFQLHDHAENITQPSSSLFSQSGIPSSIPGSSVAPSLAIPTPSVPSLDLEAMERRYAQLELLVRDFVDEKGMKMEKGPEPPRNKTHWDYVLGEAKWMANDFEREKKLKITLAKKISRGILNYHKKAVNKDTREEKAEITRKKKLAAIVSREIKKFWANIAKLVKYKHNVMVEEEKKAQMERHLEILVDQTETFSSKIASDLSKSDAITQTSTPNNTATPNNTQDTNMSDAEAESEGLDDILKGLQGGSKLSPPTSPSMSPSPPPSVTVPSTSSRRSTKRPHTAIRTTAEDSKDDAADQDFESESEEDDEATLSAEEEQEENVDAEEIKKQRAEEVSALNEEAEMSIEELKKKYGYDETVEEEEEEEQEEGDEEDEEGEDEENEEEEEEDEEEMEDAEEEDEDSSTAEEEQDDSKLAQLAQSQTSEQARVEAAADLAKTAQPSGFTLQTTTVKTKIPFLLRSPFPRDPNAPYDPSFPLRPYQHIGLDWMMSLYENGLNGILADEM